MVDPGEDHWLSLEQPPANRHSKGEDSIMDSHPEVDALVSPEGSMVDSHPGEANSTRSEELSETLNSSNQSSREM